jgi:hypothetical protein
MRLERGNHMAADAIDESARKLLGIQVPASVKGATSNLWASRKIGISEISKALRETPEANDEYKSDIDILKQRAQPLEQIDRLDMQVQKQHPLLDDIAPNIYSNTVNSRMNALVYIKSKMPKDRDELFAGQSLMSTSQKISINRSIAAALNPSELIHEMAEGDVRPETVDAVRTVYPAMFGQIQSKVAELLADPKQQSKIDRAKRIQLSKILGIPTTTATANIDLLQASWAAPEAQGTSEGGKSLAASQMQTEMQASQNRLGS